MSAILIEAFNSSQTNYYMHQEVVSNYFLKARLDSLSVYYSLKQGFCTSELNGMLPFANYLWQGRAN
jgi:hypothetical protein